MNRIAILLLATALASCGPTDEGIPVSLRGAPEDPNSTSTDRKELRVGIGAMISPAATMDLYGRLVAHLGRKLKMPGVAVQRGSYSEINDLLEQRRLDCALVCTGAFLSGRRKFGMELLAVPVFRGTPTYNSIVIVRSDSGIRSFEELKGKKFAFVDPLSNTGRLYPIWRALQLGETPEEFFRFQYTHAHDRSIRAVRAGMVDAAAVDELIYDHLERSDPGEVAGLKIIERSPPYGAPPMVVHPRLPDGEKLRIQRALLAISESEAGKALLHDLGIDRFMTAPPGLYRSVAALEKTVWDYEAEKRDR